MPAPEQHHHISKGGQLNSSMKAGRSLRADMKYAAAQELQSSHNHAQTFGNMDGIMGDCYSQQLCRSYCHKAAVQQIGYHATTLQTAPFRAGHALSQVCSPIRKHHSGLQTPTNHLKQYTSITTTSTQTAPTQQQ